MQQLTGVGAAPAGTAGAQRGGHRPADTLVVSRPSDALHLDPARSTDNESVEVVEQIYDTLIHYHPGSGTPSPGLALRWESSAQGRVWTFELRKGVEFHDGTPFNADAVVLSLERQRNPEHPFYHPDFHYWQSMFANVRAVEKVGEHLVRIVLERPYAPFLANIAVFLVGIVSPAAVERHGEGFTRHPVGTGPYRFVSWEGGRIVLERNDSYWGRRPGFRRVVFQELPDHRQRLVALESDSIDVAHAILPEEISFVTLHPRLRLHWATDNSITYLAMNTTHPPFDDPRARRAVNYAINKEPIVKVLWQGLATPAHSPLPRSQWGHTPISQPYTYDPERARALLRELEAEGRLDRNRVYTLHVPASSRPYMPTPERLGRAIQANLREVGIETTIVARPMREHVQVIQRGEHDLCIDGWVGDSSDPDNYLYVLLDRDNAEPGRATNVAFFRDARVHELLIQAQASESRSQREALYAQVQLLVHEQAPWVPLAHSKLALASRDDIGGLAMNSLGIIRYEDMHRVPSTARSSGRSVLSKPGSPPGSPR